MTQTFLLCKAGALSLNISPFSHFWGPWGTEGRHFLSCATHNCGKQEVTGCFPARSFILWPAISNRGAVYFGACCAFECATVAKSRPVNTVTTLLVWKESRLRVAKQPWLCLPTSGDVFECSRGVYIKSGPCDRGFVMCGLSTILMEPSSVAALISILGACHAFTTM